MAINRENFIVIQGWMVSELGLKGNELLIYAIIYGFSQTDKQNFTGSLQYLAEWANSTKQGVLKALKSLISKGYIVKLGVSISPTGQHTCIYHATKFNDVLNKVEWGIKQSLTPGIKQSLTNNINNNNIEDNIDNNIEHFNEEAIKEEFSRVWKEYPRKEGKDGAYKEYTKLRHKLGYDKFNEYVVLDGIKRYKDYIERNKIEPKYIKQGSTWFHGHCWEDEYPTSSSSRDQSKYCKNDLGELPF